MGTDGGKKMNKWEGARSQKKIDRKKETATGTFPQP